MSLNHKILFCIHWIVYNTSNESQNVGLFGWYSGRRRNSFRILQTAGQISASLCKSMSFYLQHLPAPFEMDSVALWRLSTFISTCEQMLETQWNIAFWRRSFSEITQAFIALFDSKKSASQNHYTISKDKTKRIFWKKAWSSYWDFKATTQITKRSQTIEPERTISYAF